MPVDNTLNDLFKRVNKCFYKKDKRTSTYTLSILTDRS